MVTDKKLILFFLILFICFNPGYAIAYEQNITITQQLNQLLKYEPNLDGAVIGVSIRSADNGQIIYQHQGDIRLRPASNLKLFTAAAALDVLGQDYISRTEILTDGKRKGKTLKGNLYLRGKGDPTLLKSDLNKLAQDVKKHQINKIEGDVIADDSWYDDIRYSIDTPWSDEDTYYGAQISALTISPDKDYDQGTIIIEITPGTKPGSKAYVKLTPPTNFVKIINKANTITEKGKKSLKIKRIHAKNSIIIEGNIPINAIPEKEWIAVWDPSFYTLNLFKQALKEQGISLKGSLIMRKVPENSKIIAFHDSLPLSARLIPFLKLSNNGHGEMLIKEMGKIEEGEGSWEMGLAVLKKDLVQFGINPETIVLRDGSGISHINLVQANQLTQLLFAVQSQKWFPEFLNALPLAGSEDKMIGGTLRNRLKNYAGKVRAKTGTLSTVSSLSGYVETKNGQTLIFSILINNLLEEEKGKKIEDKIVSVLASR